MKREILSILTLLGAGWVGAAAAKVFELGMRKTFGDVTNIPPLPLTGVWWSVGFVWQLLITFGLLGIRDLRVRRCIALAAAAALGYWLCMGLAFSLWLASDAGTIVTF